ncbi:gamma-butyrobetaine hydroxylase-like domain-containing protein [Methylobacterium sp. CM6247]
MVDIPREIRLTKGSRRLDVRWEDGTLSSLSAATLRAGSRSAGSVRASVDAVPSVPTADLVIRDVLPVGAYAVNLVFSDGHDRGIFPWSYLRTLAEGASTTSEAGHG